MGSDSVDSEVGIRWLKLGSLLRGSLLVSPEVDWLDGLAGGVARPEKVGAVSDVDSGPR